ncbi:hypothetical protein ACHAQH_008045 [Verticillium albo-atrum]
MSNTISSGNDSRICGHAMCHNCTALDVVTLSWKCCNCQQLTTGGAAKKDETKATVCEKTIEQKKPTNKWFTNGYPAKP